MIWYRLLEIITPSSVENALFQLVVVLALIGGACYQGWCIKKLEKELASKNSNDSDRK